MTTSTHNSTTTHTPPLFCTLCSNEIAAHPILDGEHRFCCPGCHAVFNILSAKNELGNFQEHPVFQQAIKSGLISNPALMEQIRAHNSTLRDEDDLEKLHMEVNDMWCPSCAEVIRLILLREKGVRNCVVDYATDLASVEFAPRWISKEKIYAIIAKLGYRASSLQSPEKKAVSFSLYLRFVVAAFFSLNIMMFAYPLYATYFHYDDQGYGQLFAWLSFWASLPVMFYSGWPILRRCLTGLSVGLVGMELLVVLGVGAAFGISLYELLNGGTRVYFDSMTVVIVFVLLGKIIEAKAKFSAKDSLLRLTRALPKRGRKRLPDGTQAFVSMKEIAPGDHLVAFVGEKIILDGVVAEGGGACDESLMTGEAIPVVKEVGSLVIGGTLLQQGSIVYRVAKTAEESALHKIMEMVEQDIGHKSLYVRAADRIVLWFVPAVIAVALMTALYCWVFAVADPGYTIEQTAILRAVAVLLISCPCAIGIAAPLAESHLLNGLAKLGAIVRNRGCLAVLGKETVFAFDKTGTVTEGRFTVTGGLAGLTPEQLSALKGLASHSTHMAAASIVKSLEGPALPFEKIEEFAGKGLRGTGGGHVYLIGSADFLVQHGVKTPIHYIPTTTTVFFAIDGSCDAAISLGDRIREEAPDVVGSLHPAKTVLLSGDGRAPVMAVARVCGFDVWKWGFNPLQKRQYIEELRNAGETVCMLGDGINDAPALTGANIGISVVTATDISIQVSDILLTTDSLRVLPKIRALAIRGHAIVRQNLFWAFFYNVIGIVLAACGLLSPIFAAFAMVASSLIVLCNSNRL